jgi:Tfp pilus assembly protein PilW
MGKRNSELHLRYYPRSELSGFSLIELLVCIGIAGFLGLGLWGLMGTQSRAYQVQDSSVGMQQNLRVAFDAISRDLSAGDAVSAGVNTISIDARVGGVLNTAGNLGDTQISLQGGQGVNFRVGMLIDVNDPTAANSEVMSVQGVAGDVLTVDTDGRTLTVNEGLRFTHAAGTPVRPIAGSITGALNAQANSAATAITLQTGQGAYFPVGSTINVSGVENMIVRSVAGDVLTIDTDGVTAGNQGLSKTHPSQALVRRVNVTATYSIANNTLRKTQSGVTTNVASNISAISLVSGISLPSAISLVPDPVGSATPRLVTLLITGRTGGRYDYRPTIRNHVTMRSN